MSNSINLKEFIERISYNKSQTYTKEEVLQELAKIQLLSIVDTLPTENIPSNKIFLVLNNEEIEGNKYDLFVYVNNKWEQIDSLEFNIEDYPTKNELDYELSLKADINHGHDNVTTSSDGFMSKEDKSKLNGIENQATRNLPSDDNPLMDGTASSGTGKDYSRKDHVHPTDTSRASSTHVHGNISNDGKIGSTANKPLITTTSGSVTTGNFETSTNNIKMNGTVNVGSSNNFARSDHVHPTDTSRASTDTATSSKNGLMSKEDKSKLDGVEDEANNYTHPSYTAKTNGLYKVTVDNTGHISGTNTVSGSDLPSHNHDTGDMKDTSAYGNIGSSANATQKTINNNINTKLGQKANSSDVYTKSQTMTSTEIGQAIADGVSNVEIFEVVTTLPTSNIKGNKFYLVPNGENIDGNVYDVNIYVNNKWETIDKLEFDISNYPTTTQVNSLLEGKVDKTDSRLTDSRTPKSHTHGNITNTGAIGSASGKIVTTGTNGVLTTSDTITKSQISDFPSTMTPSSHTHGAVQNNGTLNSDTTSTNKVVVTDSSNNIKTISKLPLDKVTHQDISGKASSTHTHGSIANNGTLNSDTTTVGKVVVTDGSNNIKTISKLPSANVTHQDISGKAPNNHKSTATTYGVGDASNYGHVKVDSSMNASSTNPVQNKVVKDYIDEQVGDIVSGDVDLSNTHNHDDRYVGKTDSRLTDARTPKFNLITASTSNIVDLNTYKTGGFYYTNSDVNYAPYIIHCPWSNGTATPYTGNKSFFLLVETWGTTSTYVKQTLTYYNGNNTYARTCNNGTWTSWKEFNTNNNDYLRFATRVISGEAIVANNIICGSTDSKYYQLKFGKIIDIRYPILFNTSAITSGSYTDNVYSSHTGVPLTNNVSGKTVTSQKQVYIEGTSFDGRQFVVSDRVFVSDDQINSTTDLGKYYIYIGVSYSTTNIRFNSFHQTVYVETRNGLVPVGDNTHNPHMLVKSDAGTAGYFKFLTIRTIGTYHDQTIEFDTTHRGNKPKTVVSFNFNTYEKTSGSKQYYTNIQAFYYHGHPTPVYYIQTNDGVQDATFDFYIRRETWDEMGVSDLRSSTNNYNGMTVTWHNEFVTALPTGTTQATLNPYYAQVGHTHGSISNNGQLNSDITSVNKVAVTDSSNNLKTISQLPYSKISGTPTSMTPTAHNQASSTITESSALNGLGTSANATQATVNSAINTKITNLNTNVGNKADKTNGASQITDTNANNYTNIGSLSSGATQQSINSAINTKIASLTNIDLVKVVTSLPTASASTMNQLYVVAKTSGGKTNDNYNIYVTVKNGSTYSWDKIDDFDLQTLSIAWGSVTGKPSTFTPTSHTHGNITNDGKIGSTANLPVITGTNGVLQAGSFGTGANTFCQGNDSRLSNTRTPTDNTVSTAKIQDSAVTSAKIADGTIVNGDIANQTIGMEKLAIHGYGGTSGTAGYVKLLRFTITATYQDRPITFKIERRHANEFINCTCTFKGENSNDPDLGTFVCSNEIGFSDNLWNAEAYLYKESTSTWCLLVRKSENYDYVQLREILNPNSGITMTKIQEFATALPTASTTNPLREIVCLNSMSEYIEGTHGTTATNVWTGTTTKLARLTKGTTIFFKMTSAGTSTGATLNLTLANGYQTGAKSVYYNATTALTTHFPQNTVLHLVYDGSKWVNTAIQNTNTDTHNALEQGTRINVGEAVSANTIVGKVYGDSNGYYKKLVSGLQLDTSYPIFFIPTATTGATNGYQYPYHLKIGVNLQTTVSGVTITSNKQVFVEGTALDKNKFTVSSKVFVSEGAFTTNNYYIPIGGSAGSTTAINFNSIDSRVFRATSATNLVPVESSLYALSSHTHTKSQITDFPTSMTPTAHTNATASNIGQATGSVFGHTKLSDNYTSSAGNASQGIGASSQAVKSVYDIANGKSTVSVKQTKTSGIEIGSVTVNGTETKLYQQDNNTTYTAESTATNIKMNGTQSAGSLATYARGDHVHPSDTKHSQTGIPANANLNSYVTPGWYNNNSNADVKTMTNTPWTEANNVNGSLAFAMEVLYTYGVVQIMYTYNDYNIYFRRSGNPSHSGWTAWKKIYNSGNLTKADITALGIPSQDTNTTYGADRGISNVSGKFGHSNTAITAQTTSALKKIKYDAYGHITGTDNVGASDLPSHTHSYLPLSGGTLTGAVSSNSNITTSGTIQGATIKKTNGTNSQLLLADGSIKSTGDFATSWHSHTFTEITKSGEEYCRVWIDTELRRIRVTASRNITVSSTNVETFINFSSKVLVDDAYLPPGAVYAQTNWNGVIVGVSLEDGVKGRLRVRSDRVISNPSLTEAYLEWTYDW